MTIRATFAGLLIAAGALMSAPVAGAAPLTGPLSLGQAEVAPVAQVQYRHRYSRRAYRSYAYRGYGRRGCVSGDDSTTSAYPSWQVCHGGRYR